MLPSILPALIDVSMIETNFFILTPEQYQETAQDAAIEGVSIDYYLLEFCQVEGDWITVEN